MIAFDGSMLKVAAVLSSLLGVWFLFYCGFIRRPKKRMGRSRRIRIKASQQFALGIWVGLLVGPTVALLVLHRPLMGWFVQMGCFPCTPAEKGAVLSYFVTLPLALLIVLVLNAHRRRHPFNIIAVSMAPLLLSFSAFLWLVALP